MTGFNSKQRMAADKNNRKRGSIALARSLCYEIAGATNGDDDISGCEYGSVDIAEILSAEIERLREALAQPALLVQPAREFYDQTALELCGECGWKTLIPNDGCLNCEREQPVQEPASYLHTVINAFGPDEGISLDQKAWSQLHAAIKAALVTPPQPAQKPVAWRWSIKKLNGGYEWRYTLNKTRLDSIPLYAVPQKRNT